MQLVFATGRAETYFSNCCPQHPDARTIQLILRARIVPLPKCAAIVHRIADVAKPLHMHANTISEGLTP